MGMEVSYHPHLRWGTQIECKTVLEKEDGIGVAAYHQQCEWQALR